MPRQENQYKYIADNLSIFAQLANTGLSSRLTRDLLNRAANKNGNYSFDEQNDAFVEIGSVLNNINDDKLKKISKAYGDKFANSLSALKKSYPKEKKNYILSENIKNRIEESGYQNDKNMQGLAKALDGMSDKDVREYLYTNGDWFKNHMPSGFLKQNSDIHKMLITPPDYKEKSVQEMFNDKDILDKLNTLSMSDINIIARENGYTSKELLKILWNEKAKQDRYRVAHGEDEGGWFASPKAFAKNLLSSVYGIGYPRGQKAIEEGREPSAKDYVGDIGEQAILAAPVGRGAGILKASFPRVFGSKAGKPITSVISNVSQPLATEVMDNKLYGEGTDRGDFRWSDVFAGATTNTMTPFVLSRWGKLGGKVGGQQVNTRSLVDDVTSFGEGLSKEQVKKDIGKFNTEFVKESVEQAKKVKNMPKFNKTPMAKEFQRDNIIAEFKQNQLANEMPDFNYQDRYKEIYEKIRKGNVNYDDFDKFDRAFIKNEPQLDKMMFKKDFNGVVREDIIKDNKEIENILDDYKSNMQLLREASLGGYTTNRLGQAFESQGQTNLPIIGPKINKYIEEAEREDKAEKKKLEQEKKWKDKWKVDFSSIW